MSHLILALCPTLLDKIDDMNNLLYCHKDNLHNLDLNNHLHYQGNLIHFNLKLHQLNLDKIMVEDLDWIHQWHRSMNLLDLLNAFDFNANDLTSRRPRSLDQFDDFEINILNLMAEMMHNQMVLRKAMCKPLTSPELNVNTFLTDGTVVMMASST